MRCDLHVHSWHSGTFRLPILDGICRESYSPPQAIYARLKEQGMELVTLTDHDSIDGCEELRRYPDFFVSEEVTCVMPSGTEAHVAVYDISEKHHIEIQRRRDDVPRLLNYLTEEEIFYSAQHIFSRLTGRREADDFEWFATRFPALETLNAHLLGRNNDLAAIFAATTGKSETAGSDGHTLRSAGSAYTEVAGAANMEQFLRGLRQGRGRARGESGTLWKMTRDVIQVVALMMAEEPLKAVFAPLMLAIPAFTMLHFCQEKFFTRKWGRAIAASGLTGARRGAACAGSAEAVA